MAARFEIIDEEYVEELKGKIEKASSIRPRPHEDDCKQSP